MMYEAWRMVTNSVQSLLFIKVLGWKDSHCILIEISLPITIYLHFTYNLNFSTF